MSGLAVRRREPEGVITEFLIAAPPAQTTAIVLANGPSLKGVDLAALPPVATFGMNAAYRHWDRIGWSPTHYACVDEVVGLHHAEAIGRLVHDSGSGRPGAFLLRNNVIEHLGLSAGDPRITNFDTARSVSRAFARQPVTTGSHALIWAIALGYTTVFLLGADANYVERVEGAEPIEGPVLEIRREAENPNYFFDDYQRVGDRYHVPNYDDGSHVRSWRAAAAVAAEAGAQVYNLSSTSRIDAFDFSSLDDLLAGGPMRVVPRELSGAVRTGREQPVAMSAPFLPEAAAG